MRHAPMASIRGAYVIAPGLYRSMTPITIPGMLGYPEKEIHHYLDTGEYDHPFSAWPAGNCVARSTLAHDALRQALVRAVRKRTEHAVEPEALLGVDVVALTRAKVAPMVRGLFPRSEQQAVLEVLGRSVIFLKPSNIDAILGETRWHGTAWALANLYLVSVGAEPLADDAPRIVGLSEETTCYVSMEYFRPNGRFEDFIVHEAAHIFHNCKRGTIGLRQTRRREWLLHLEFKKRETFAHACEAYSRMLEHGVGPADRRRLLDELKDGPMPPTARVDLDEYFDILRAAVVARNGWKHILARCSPPRRTHQRELEAP